MKNFPRQMIYQVDAFTDQIFKGNPAAVMIVDHLPTDEYMQNVAMEMNLSETTFVCPDGDRFQIRYFTPLAEIPLAGHPTLAAAHILYEIGRVAESDQIIFEAKAAQLSVNKEGDLVIMRLPAYSLKEVEVPSVAKQLIGFDPIAVFESDYDWVIAVASDETDIVNSNPDFTALMRHGLGHMMITAKSDAADLDFVVRCFAPSLGVNEDPVTGSAHCALTPLWAERLGKTALESKQLSKRTGRLSLNLIDDKVEIKGKAITVFEAKLK